MEEEKNSNANQAAQIEPEKMDAQVLVVSQQQQKLQTIENLFGTNSNNAPEQNKVQQKQSPATNLFGFPSSSNGIQVQKQAPQIVPQQNTNSLFGTYTNSSKVQNPLQSQGYQQQMQPQVPPQIYIQQMQVPQQPQRTLNNLFGIPGNNPHQQVPLQMNTANMLPQQQKPAGSFSSPVWPGSIPSSNLFGDQNHHGRWYNQLPKNPELFNDDQNLIEQVKQESGKEISLQISIKAQRSVAKLQTQTILPAMCSIKSSGGNRTSVDLVCLIDVSGSMTGQKIKLVKDTMNFLIDTLTPADRLSIIAYDHLVYRICPFRCVTADNAIALKKDVDRLYANGGNNIIIALDVVVKTLRERQMKNKVTSLFWLSDGQERKESVQQFKDMLNLPINKNIGVFSIHSFGFGTDHDQNLMKKICQIKDGNFYFIKQLATLDEAFCNALGGIISLVANQVFIKITNISKGLVSGVKISKTYGGVWEKQHDKEYSIHLSQIMSGVTKDFVFEIVVPAIDAEVGDIERDHDIIHGEMIVKGVNGQIIQGDCKFKLTLLNSSQEIPEVNENVDVIENYLRVKATEAIEENMRKANQQKYEQAQKGLDQMISSIQGNKKVRQQNMGNLVNDLKLIKQKCNKQEYHVEGQKWAVNAQYAHSSQNNFQYSNPVQTRMVQEQKCKKMGFN